MTWKYFLPEQGETLDDAREIIPTTFFTAEHAAEIAAERAWDDGGWELGIGSTETIVVVSPQGEHSTWIVTHDVTVDHHVSRKEEK